MFATKSFKKLSKLDTLLILSTLVVSDINLFHMKEQNLPQYYDLNCRFYGSTHFRGSSSSYLGTIRFLMSRIFRVLERRSIFSLCWREGGTSHSVLIGISWGLLYESSNKTAFRQCVLTCKALSFLKYDS